MPGSARPKMYWDLAPWFHLITHPKDYASEARWVRKQFPSRRGRGQKPTMLELGSGGGNNALHLKMHFALTLTDLSPRMLALSATINPDCEHIAGDMRTLRLKRQFDVVFLHDAISYMASARDLRRAIKTAFVHSRPGGMVLFQPDDVRETFRPTRESGGHDVGRRAARYTELTQPLKPGRDSTTVDYTITLTERDGSTRVFADCHRIGVFSRLTWLAILKSQGFRAQAIVDPWRRTCFLAQRPPSSCDTRTQRLKRSRARKTKFA